MDSQLSLQKMLKKPGWLYEWVDDLENGLHQNNLQLVGLPENIPAHDLNTINLSFPRKVEKIHRIGLSPIRPQSHPSTPKDWPRETIMWYLNFSDKEDVLKAYHRFRGPLQLRGHKVLIFGDYTANMDIKHRAFNSVCTALHNKNICFRLL